MGSTSKLYGHYAPLNHVVTAAATRCNVRFAKRSGCVSSRDGTCPTPLWLLVLLSIVVLLRVNEDSYARAKGYNGATLSTHPLRMLTFSERISSERLLSPS